MKPVSISVRLTAWYAGCLTVILAILGLAT